MVDKNLFLNLPFLIILSDIIEVEEILSGPDPEYLINLLISMAIGITASKIKYKGLSKIIIRNYFSK